nr:hypothetical protein [Candidatus Dadabacteria bacterium]
MIDQNFRVFNKTISVSLLEQIENPFRALDFAGEVTQKISGRYGIQNLNGYGSSILRHYSEIYGLIWDRPNFPAGINSMPLFPIEQVKNKELLNLLNTRFIITDRNLKIPN